MIHQTTTARMTKSSQEVQTSRNGGYTLKFWREQDGLRGSREGERTAEEERTGQGEGEEGGEPGERFERKGRIPKERSGRRGGSRVRTAG